MTLADDLAEFAHHASEAPEHFFPAGAIMAFGGAAAPDGWLLCDGSTASRTEESALFNAIGTGYGSGDGSTTFTLPDLRGRAPIGAGQGSGLSDRPLGTEVGEEDHTLSVSEMPEHEHTYARAARVAGGAIESGNEYDVSTTSESTTSRGSGEAHNNMQPSLSVNFIIKR